MTRMFFLTAFLGSCFLMTGCGPSTDTVFEESAEADAAEIAENEEYEDAMKAAEGAGYDGKGGDPFAHTQE